MEGDDFTFEKSAHFFGNIEKLKDFFHNDNNTKIKLQLKYSTLSDYFEQFQKDISFKDNIKKSHKDFLPYADAPGDWWTGFYTSRSQLKYLIRNAGRKLLSAQNIISIAKIRGSFNYYNDNQNLVDDQVKSLSTEVGMAQHHDSVTGTSLERVARDTNRRVTQALERVEEV